MSDKRIYETILVYHPDMSEEDVEAGLKSTTDLLEINGSEMIRTERGGKRRLAYVVQKQRYGYYNLMHYRGTSEALVELERMFRLNDRVLRYLTVRFDKEDQLSGLTRMGDDEGRDDDRDDRRRGGGRRGDFGGPRGGRDRGDRDRGDRDQGDRYEGDRDRGRDRDMPPATVEADSESSPEFSPESEPVVAVDTAAVVEEAVATPTETVDATVTTSEEAVPSAPATEEPPAADAEQA